MYKSGRWVAVSLFGMMLAACGGGGDGGGVAPVAAVTITSGNMDAVASAALTAQSSNLAAGGAALDFTGVVGAETNASSRAVNALTKLTVDRFLATFDGGQGQTGAMGIQGQQTYNCSLGGSFTASYNVTDPNVLNAGDQMTLTFNNCQEAMSTMAGTMQFVVNAYAGNLVLDSFVGTFDLSVQYTHFTMSTAQGAVSFNGDMRMSANTTNANFSDFTLRANSLAYTVNAGGQQASMTLSNVDSFFRDNKLSSQSEVDDNYYFAAVLPSFSGAAGVTTLATVVIPWDSLAPTSGKLQVAGSNSTLFLTFLSGGNVLLELDSDNDGDIDVSHTLTWAQLDLMAA